MREQARACSPAEQKGGTGDGGEHQRVWQLKHMLEPEGIVSVGPEVFLVARSVRPTRNVCLPGAYITARTGILTDGPYSTFWLWPLERVHNTWGWHRQCVYKPGTWLTEIYI